MKIFERISRLFNKKKPIKPKSDLIGFGVHYMPSKIHHLVQINNLKNEIVKSGIWVELNTENVSRYMFSVNFKKEDKYIANTCYRNVFGNDIFKFTDEERRIIKNKIRKEKIRKIEEIK